MPRGTAFLATQQVIVYASSFAFYLIIARTLTPSEVGQVSLLTAALAVFTVLTQFALPSTATRFISRNIGLHDYEKASAVTRTTFRLLLTVAGLGTVLATLLSPWVGQVVFNSSSFTVLLVTTFLAGLLLDITALYGGYLLGIGFYAGTLYQNTLYVPLSRGLGILLALLGLGVYGIVLGWALGSLVTVFFSAYLWRGRLLERKGSHPVRPLLNFSVPLFAASIVTLGQSWGDIAILQWVLGQIARTGTYYVAVSSVSFLSILWSPVASALYPALSAADSAKGNVVNSERLVVAQRLVNLVILPLSASLGAVAPTVLDIAYGPTYSQEAVSFEILMMSVVFVAQSALLVTGFQALGRTRPLLKVTLTATVLDLALVALTAGTLGTTAGALGRAVLSISTVILAYVTIRPVLASSPQNGWREGLALAVGVGGPLWVSDQVMTHVLLVPHLLRLGVLGGIFFTCLIMIGRKLAVFSESDFLLAEAALPNTLRVFVRTAQKLFVG